MVLCNAACMQPGNNFQQAVCANPHCMETFRSIVWALSYNKQKVDQGETLSAEPWWKSTWPRDVQSGEAEPHLSYKENSVSLPCEIAQPLRNWVAQSQGLTLCLHSTQFLSDCVITGEAELSFVAGIVYSCIDTTVVAVKTQLLLWLCMHCIKLMQKLHVPEVCQWHDDVITSPSYFWVTNSACSALLTTHHWCDPMQIAKSGSHWIHVYSSCFCNLLRWCKQAILDKPTLQFCLWHFL